MRNIRKLTLSRESEAAGEKMGSRSEVTRRRQRKLTTAADWFGSERGDLRPRNFHAWSRGGEGKLKNALHSGNVHRECRQQAELRIIAILVFSKQRDVNLRGRQGAKEVLIVVGESVQ